MKWTENGDGLSYTEGGYYVQLHWRTVEDLAKTNPYPYMWRDIWAIRPVRRTT